MARKAILETAYTFVPISRRITIPRAILRERLILITNVTTNTVIYNFSDSNLGATAYSVNSSNYAQGVTQDADSKVVTGARDTTTIDLVYNTTSMSANDKLQIIVDEYDFYGSSIKNEGINSSNID
jgi:hypothetical protein